jgi:hypothetical protein
VGGGEALAICGASTFEVISTFALLHHSTFPPSLDFTYYLILFFPRPPETTKNMAQNILSRKTGVIVGDDVLNLFKYAQEKKFAIPAIVSRHRHPQYSFRS